MSRSRSSAFERLFEAQAEPLFAFLVYRTGDRQLAEDLVADTFERVLRARARFDPRRGSEKNWVYAIALNLVRVHRDTRALRPAGPASARSTSRCVDQQARQRRGRPLNSPPRCLIRLDRPRCSAALRRLSVG
jgi:DNA-directed RNA polymerase specialized sigma24 family protein